MSQPVHEIQQDIADDLHPAVAGALRWFDDAHLPEHLKTVTGPIKALAHEMAHTLSGTQLTHGLHDLLRAKDAFVRAAVEKVTGK
jgi:hypothetical protein